MKSRLYRKMSKAFDGEGPVLNWNGNTLAAWDQHHARESAIWARFRDGMKSIAQVAKEISEGLYPGCGGRRL